MRFDRHPHLRKRITRNLEPFPARTFWMRSLDGAVFLAGIIGPLMTLPQIILIYGTQQAAGVSPYSWGAFAILDIPWVLYGLAHRETPIVTTYILWFLFNAAVCVGALIY